MRRHDDTVLSVQRDSVGDIAAYEGCTIGLEHGGDLVNVGHYI